MLVYAVQLTDDPLAHFARDICHRKLNLSTCDLEPPARAQSHLAVLFTSSGRFPKHRFLCCSPSRFEERKIVVPRWASGTSFQIALNGEYDEGRFRDAALLVRFQDALREASRIFKKRTRGRTHGQLAPSDLYRALDNAGSATWDSETVVARTKRGPGR